MFRTLSVLCVTCALIAPVASANDPLQLTLNGAWDKRTLPGSDGKDYSAEKLWDDRTKGLVIIVTRNTCPIAEKYEERLADLAKLFSEKQVRFVALNVDNGPGEGIEFMKAKKLPYPYLHHPTKEVAKAVGAKTTPEVALFYRDSKGQLVLEYQGAIDSDPTGKTIKEHYLLDALTALSEGKEVSVPRTTARGCSIRY